MFGNYIPCPTKDLVQSYLMKDGTYYSAQPGYETKQFVEEFQNRDPRMWQTLAWPGWELINTMTYAPGARHLCAESEQELLRLPPNQRFHQ